MPTAYRAYCWKRANSMLIVKSDFTFARKCTKYLHI